MPRDANGNYTLPTGNPVVTQTDITSTWANDTMSDVGNEMTDSLSRSGKGGMTGPFPIIDKQGNVPGLSFAAEPTSGLEREAAGDMRAQVLGTDKMRWTSGGDADVWRNSTWNPVAIEPTDRQVMYGEGGVTTIFHYGTTVAPGWELVEPDANIRQLVIGPAAGGGAIGGVEDPNDHTYNLNVTVTVAGNTNFTDISHGHTYSGTTSGPSQVVPGGSVPNAASPSHTHSFSGTTSSSGGSHNHVINLTDQSGTGTLQIQPRYARGLLMKLTAYA